VKRITDGELYALKMVSNRIYTTFLMLVVLDIGETSFAM